jgi:hypothetical protein
MIRRVSDGQEYRIIYQALPPGNWWAADIVAEVCTMWTKTELKEEMIKEGWQPENEEGKFIHRETGKDININDKDGSGAIIWISYCMAHVTPPPF